MPLKYAIGAVLQVTFPTEPEVEAAGTTVVGRVARIRPDFQEYHYVVEWEPTPGRILSRCVEESWLAPVAAESPKPKKKKKPSAP